MSRSFGVRGGAGLCGAGSRPALQRGAASPRPSDPALRARTLRPYVTDFEFPDGGAACWGAAHPRGSPPARTPDPLRLRASRSPGLSRGLSSGVSLTYTFRQTPPLWGGAGLPPCTAGAGLVPETLARAREGTVPGREGLTMTLQFPDRTRPEGAPPRLPEPFLFARGGDPGLGSLAAQVRGGLGASAEGERAGRSGARARGPEGSANSHLHPSFKPAGWSWQEARGLGRGSRGQAGRLGAPPAVPLGQGGGHFRNNSSPCCFWVHGKCDSSSEVGIALRGGGATFQREMAGLGRRDPRTLGGRKGTPQAPGLCLPLLTWV